jgi:two-component system cell cycle response regulator CtrA
MRILLGSPDYDRVGLARLLMAEDGRVVDLAEPFQDVVSIAQHSGPYDAVILSVTDGRGQAGPVLREMRRAGVNLPILVLAMRVSDEEEGELLDLGADDVLTWPVAPRVLAARLRAMQRRTLGHASPVLVCGNVELDQARHTVSVDGRRAVISSREYTLLETLMLRRGMLVTKDALMSRLYGDEDWPVPRIIDVFVCKLRRKLAAAGAAEIVRTVWGHGYTVEDPGADMVEAARANWAAGLPRMSRPTSYTPPAWQHQAPAGVAAS